MNEQVESCLKFLKSRFISVRREWCEACLEWIAEEQSGLPNINDLTNLVYEQWLMADLQEIALPVLPHQMSRKNGLHVYKGTFVVQMNEMIDIGHSAYSQFAKLNGDEIDDIGDNEDDELKQFFMGKPDKKGPSTNGTKPSKESTSRMLFLKLSDGHQSVEAIEYQPIKQLSVETTLPGGKIRLNGPLTCRDGLILLERHHVEVIGGNVEELVESASQIKLLGQILDIDVSVVDTKGNIPQVSNNANNNENRNTSNNTNIDRNSHNNGTSERIDHSKQAGDVNDDILINDIFEDIEVEDDIDDIALSQAIDNQIPTVLNDASKSVKTVPAKQSTSTTDSSDKKTSNQGNQGYHGNSGNQGNQGNQGNRGNQGKQGYQRNSRMVGEVVVTEPVIKEEYEDLTDDIFSDDISMLRDATPHKPLNRLSTGPKKGVDIIEIREEEDEIGVGLEDHGAEKAESHATACSDADKVEDQDKCEETTLADVIARKERTGRTIGLQASFTTLTSKLVFDPSYRLEAIITDGERFLDVILGDEVLEILVGHSAKEVQEAAAGNLPRPQRKSIRAGLLGAEKLLEVEKWKLKMKYDESENIFHVVQMNTCAAL